MKAESQQQDFVIETILNSPWHMQTLRTVAQLNLPDWAIAAGFIRNAVWDRLHNFKVNTPLTDIDVLYFDNANLDKAFEIQFEKKLFDILPDRPWSIRNQARMHVRNSDHPYSSTADAMTHWLETPTCVAVHLDHRDQMSVTAPFGLNDLMKMRGKPTQAGRKRIDQYRKRMKAKHWPRTWPMVRVEGLD